MYLDRHDAPGITAEELAEAHRLDTDVQEKYGVRYSTNWFDPDRGTVFCLAEGPSERAVVAVHEEAHWQLPSAVIELDPTAPLNALLGPLPTHPVDTAYSEPAMRAIVFTDIRGSVAQTIELGDDGHMAVLHAHDDIVRRALEQHAGREVKHTGDGIMAAFASVSASVEFAINTQRAFAAWNAESEPALHVGIGISAGEPVTGDNDDPFGAAVQLAARLCGAAQAGDIAVSVAVRELCIGKRFGFVKRGAIPLKGIPCRSTSTRSRGATKELPFTGGGTTQTLIAGSVGSLILGVIALRANALGSRRDVLHGLSEAAIDGSVSLPRISWHASPSLISWRADGRDAPPWRNF